MALKRIFVRLMITGLVSACCLCFAATGKTEAADVLPPVPDKGETLSAVPAMFVKRFRFTGNTVFPEETLRGVVGAYENRRITSAELQEAKKKLTLFYYGHGFVNSGAVIPDQKMEDGIVRIQIIEGRITRLVISGNRRLKTGYIKGRLGIQTGPGGEVLNANHIQERLKRLKQDSKIENVNGKITPGLNPGEAVLEVEVTETDPHELSFAVNNHNSPSIGALRGEVQAAYNNLTGWGDSIRGMYGRTEGLNDYALGYTIPVTRWNTTLSLNLDHSESDIVTEPFDELDIRSETTTYAATLRHPVYKTLSSEAALGLTLDKSESETFLLDDAFSFSPGVVDGQSEIAALRFFQEWVDRSMRHVFAIRSAFHFGVDMMGATIHDDDRPDGEFISWLGQAQYIRRLSFLNSQIFAGANLQLTGDPMLPAEKFAVGGHATVRGYRENQMTTDNGATVSLEWRLPVARLRIPGVGKRATDGRIRLIPFFDWGKGWNEAGNDPDPDTIYSLGLGASWDLGSGIFAEIYWGHAFEDIDITGEHDIQDDGIHFQVRARVF